MKRLVIWSFSSLFILVVLAAIAVAMLPRFVDVNDYKVQASEKIKEATGYDVVFDGDVSMGLLPMPYASLADVRVKNPAGFSGENLATFKSLDVQVALAPLLSKRVEVQAIRLQKPKVFLEANESGKTNWSVEHRPVEEKRDDGSPSESANISLNGIEILGGMLSYKNGTAAPIVIDDINLDVDANSLQGPFDIEGRLKGFEQNLKFKTKIQELKDLATPLSLTASGSISPANVAFNYAGVIDIEKQAAQGQTDVKFEAGQLKGMMEATAKGVSFTDMVLAASGHSVKGAMSATFDPVTFKGKVNADGTDLSVSGTYKDVLNVAVKADIVDLDKILGQSTSNAGLNQPLGLPPAGGSSKSAAPLGVVFDVAIAKAIYQGQAVSDIKTNGALKGSSLGLKSFSVGSVAGTSLKGSGEVADIKAMSGIDGRVSGTISDLAAFSKLTKVDVSSLPPSVKSLGFDVDAKGALKGVLDVSASAKALNGVFTAKGKVQNAGAKPAFDNLALTIKHPNFSQLLKVVAPDAPRYASFAKPLNLNTSLAMTDKLVTLNGIKASLGKTSMNGGLAINTGASKPSLRGSLTFGDLVLQSSGAAPAGGSSAKASGTSGKAKWSSAKMNSGWLNAMNADLDIKATSLLYQSWDVKNPSIKFVMQNGTLDVKDLKAGLYGGTLELSSVLKPLNANGTGMNITTNAQFNDVDLEKLAGSFIGTKVVKASGKASLSTQVSGQGMSQAALVSSLNGKGALSGQNIILEGFDVAQFARSMSLETKPGDSVLGLWGTTKGGTTTFDTLKGQYSIAKGVINLTELALDGKTAAIQSSGTVSLPKWYMDTTHSITAKGSELPPFSVDIKGPLDNPGQTFAQGAIQNYLQQKLKRKLDKVLGDKLNLGGGDAPIEQQLLNKFLGDKLGVPQAPANDNTPPADTQHKQAEPQTPAAAPVKKEEPKAQPADPVDQILKEVVPDEAVQDLIKGLF